MVKIFKSFKINTIIHAAFTVTPVKNYQRREVLINDLMGTKNIFISALKANIDHVIYISSTLAYGATVDNKSDFEESDDLLAGSKFHYAYHKKLVEEKICIPFMNKYSNPIMTILRPCSILGPHICNYVTETLKWKILPFIYEGRNTRIQWLHENDFLQAIKQTIEKRKKGIFNITPDDSISFLEQTKYLPRKSILVPEKISRYLGKLMWDLNLSSAPPSYLDFVRYPFTASNKLAKKELGFFPKYTSKESILSIYN